MSNKDLVHICLSAIIAMGIIVGIGLLLSTWSNKDSSPSVIRLIHTGKVTDYRFDGNLRYAVVFSDGYMFFTKSDYMGVVDCNLTELTELDMNQTYYLWEFHQSGSTNYVLTLCNDYVDRVRIKYPENIFYIEQENK